MKSQLLSLSLAAAALFGAAPALSAAPRLDEGMWLFNEAPIAAIQKAYGFQLTQAWLEHVQKSCVRFSTGGSGSLVSKDGLVMTNHHVASEVLAQLSTSERDLLAKGYLAKGAAEELPCPDLELLVLWTIEDVTARVEGAAKPGMSAAEGGAAKRAEISRIEKESGEKSGLKAEVVTLYKGARYHLYSYKRFTDVRLVFAPEKAAAFFGGDPDNFEFPRFCLDVTFFRIYEGGKPLQPEHHLTWSADGADAGELVFVAGHPGSTERQNTVAHLEYFRDVRYPRTLARLWRREVQLHTFMGRKEEWRRIGEEDLFGVQNSRKALSGRLEGLLDPAIMGPKLEAERRLQAFVWSDPARSAKWGDAWDRIEQAQHSAASLWDLSAAQSGGGSVLFGTARSLVRAAAERPKPSAERLREYSDAALPRLEQQLFSPAPVHADLEVDALRSWLLSLGENLGGDHALTKRALGGKSPGARAEELVRGSSLLDPAGRRALWDGGQAAIDACQEPLVRLLVAIDADERAVRKRLEDEVDAVQRVAYGQIAEAQFALYGTSVYPDATFTLRLSYGKVAGYEQDGEQIAPFTNLGGKFERSRARGGQAPFDLPASWVAAEARLDKSVPYNFVSTNDIIGGNSGSPVVDKAGEVVGLIFDGNIQSLVGALAYSETQARSVSVDSRGMIEALRVIYGAEALVKELTARAR
jgi:hypothetical protein